MAAVEAAHEKIHAMGAPRVQTYMSIATRTDRTQSMRERIESVAAKRAVEA